MIIFQESTNWNITTVDGQLFERLKTVCERLGYKTTCGGRILNNSLWNSSAVIVRTVLHAGELCLTNETAFLSGPAGFKSAYLQSCSVTVVLGSLDVTNRRVSAWSTVSGRVDFT